MTIPTTPDISNPFPGLRCFQPDEDFVFFGRHQQIEDLLRRLRTNRLVAVVGTSGSGKSSLVRAGLLPAVLGGAESQEESIQFVDLLLQATREAENVYVVLTMRSDFLGECSQFLGLAEAVNNGEFLIPRMTRDQIQEAIEGPIRVQGAEIAPRLLFRLLNDVEDDQDQLPVLQHALMRTWALWSRAGKRPAVGDQSSDLGDQSSQ